MTLDPRLSHFRSLAGYNRWANRRIYAACAQLPEAEYLAPRPAFFKSLHGTLNHILVGDRVWMSRFTGAQHHIKSLDQQLYADLAGLRVAREAEDAQILAYVEGLTEDSFAEPLSYKTMAGAPQHDPLDRLLTHFFNHQTHHRGQAHGLLSQTAVPPPELDYIFFLRTAKSS
ncbi:MAG: damage-inducible protein DinB [Alphaproteobacteria bacterium]|nr:damage-inducible protein DinB [Alphaproteobacteria bacterium]